MKSYKAIVYDLDGTLLDTYEMNTFSLLKVLHEEGFTHLNEEDLKPFFAMAGLDVMYLLKIKEPHQAYARWVEYANHYQAHPFNGVEDVLKLGKTKGFLQGIVSSKMRKQYQIDFVAKGLDRWIDASILKDDAQKLKPHPEPLLKVCQQLNIKPEEAIYVGDAITDYQATQAAGMDFAYATWGSMGGEGIEKPTVVVNSPKELLIWMESLTHTVD
jgi:N-acetyl-D-muramate 6-phosphate phosphatase